MGREFGESSMVSWFSLVIIVLAQLQMAINISALPVSLGPISEDLGAPATATASASPKQLAGDVGALRGVANNVSNALGAAFASVVAVGLLGLFLNAGFARSELPPTLTNEVLFNDVDFVTNSELRRTLDATLGTPAQVAEAVAINEDARLQALQASFLIIGGISLLAIFPATRLPRYARGELSAEDIVNEAERSARAVSQTST